MPQVEALRDEGSRLQVVTAGAVAGLVSRFFIAPLDVLKIRLQISHSLSDPLSRPRYSSSTLRTFSNIIRHEGFTALWKGNVPAEFLYLTYGSIQFLTYRTTTQLLSSIPYLPPSATSFIAGATAGTLATTLTYPLDLLRTRFAAQGNDRVYASLAASVRTIYRTEGPKGFFRGLSAGVGQVLPYMGLFFTLYEGLKVPMSSVTAGNFLQDKLGGGEALAGMAASVLSKSAVFPLDTVRKRLQVQGPTRKGYGKGDIPVYEKGIWNTIRTIVRREGMRGLYRGLPVSLVKAAPASAITVWTYERAMGVMRSFDDDGEGRCA
ncbi:mitochondrial carrier [Myriangium duriaei CBS 260.36]|uniref:Mitochondrial carrier n=1 Tax=Myriangium duriaei CBS 260.36 TaxID=1168546 RepID=A0A9P4J0N2_9PEZI|nr:mitochondrial carrier [Myriangium duriaei CBS 260.36]